MAVALHGCLGCHCPPSWWKGGDGVFSLFVFWGKLGRGTEQVPGGGMLHLWLLGFLLCIS